MYITGDPEGIPYSVFTEKLPHSREIAYDRDMAFSEEKFLSILRGIDIDTILIAHQKSTLSTTHPYKNDVRTLGEDRFHEFIYTDYFEAFEFKNRKNEVFNKNFMSENNFTESIRFITGSDCHDWREYPKIDSKDKTDFRFTYVKCIPNFRGLVMAITDHRRIKTINSFFNPTENYLQDIRLSIDGNPYTIPLSKGINVIIGDNSIGKSLLLHKLTGYIKNQDGLLKQAVLKGYETYLKNNGIEITTEIPRGEIFGFDMQGEVRDKFEQGKLKSDDFLKQYVNRAFLDQEYINEEDLPVVRTLLRPFSNVRVSIEKIRQDDGHLDCVISADAFLGGETLRYEIRDNGRRKKYYDPLAWIDEIERWDALFF